MSNPPKLTCSPTVSDLLKAPDLAEFLRTTYGYAKHNYEATVDPGVNDDAIAGYSVGSLWINTVNLEAFRCVDATSAAAVWIESTLDASEVVALINATEKLPMSLILAGNITDGTGNIGPILLEGTGGSVWAAGGAVGLSYTIEVGNAYETYTETWVIAVYLDNVYLGRWYTEDEVPYPHLATTWVLEDGPMSGTPIVTSGDYISKLGVKAVLDLSTSMGGNGATDSGKVLVFDAAGRITGYGLTVTAGSFIHQKTSSGTSKVTVSAASLGGAYTVSWANNSGTIALTASSTGVPDNISPPLEKILAVDADELVIRDSAASSVAKRLSFANLWTWILSKLGGNLTIGGTKTWSGQQQATGQAATNGESLMTRDLGDTRYKQNTYSELANDSSSVVNSTTLVDTGNTITLDAGTWRVRIVDLLTSNSSTAGVKNQVLFSQSCTHYGRVVYGDANVGIPRVIGITKQSASSIGGNNVGSTAAWYEYDFVIVIPSSTTIKTQFANATAGTGNTTTAKAGSHIIATKMS